MFFKIVKDMESSAGFLAPSNHWNWQLGKWHLNTSSKAKSYSEELFDKNYSELPMMLDPWVGVTGMKFIDELAVSKYLTYINEIDHLGMLPSDLLEHGKSNGWRETDLGSIIDVNLIKSFSNKNNELSVKICEVGGGYGRLAEVILNGAWPKLHYLLIDAVPGSLSYAFLYLKTQFPALKIGAYFNDDEYDETYDCYILPSWHTDILANNSFDICINVESMQEMEQKQVDFYLSMFDRLLSDSGLIYLSNSREYVFKGKWNIPKHWNPLYLSNTPRSWTKDHPTQIFEKGDGDFSSRRLMLESLYNYKKTLLDNVVDPICSESTTKSWIFKIREFFSKWQG